MINDEPDQWRVTKMRWRSKTDHSAIVYSSCLTLAGIPSEAHEYRLGSKTALEWLIDRYRITTDQASGIVNDPNDWADEHGDPRYIVDLIKRITTVSVETVKIVNSLPELDLGKRVRRSETSDELWRCTVELDEAKADRKRAQQVLGAICTPASRTTA